MRAIPDLWKKQYRTIYEVLLEKPRISGRQIIKILGTKAARRRIEEALDLFFTIVGPEIRKRSFENLTEYMYFVKCEDPEMLYLKYRKDPRVTYHASAIGFSDLWIISNQEIEVEGEVVLKGPRSDFYVSRAPDHSCNDALEIMKEKIETFCPTDYTPKGLIQTHWNEAIDWDEEDDLLYQYFKYNLRKLHSQAMKENLISKDKIRDFLRRLPQCCTISTGYFPEGLLSYDYYLYKFETDYEDFIIDLFSELPTTSYFFKVSDKLFANIRAPQEITRNVNPKVAKREYIPLLIMNLKEKGIIKRKERAIAEHHWGKNL